MSQIGSPDINIDPFKLVPGESQTQDLTLSLRGVNEVLVREVSFEDGEISGWISVEREIPFAVNQPSELGWEASIVIPINVTVPPSYTGKGGKVSAHIDLSYGVDGQANVHSVVQELEIVVEEDASVLCPIFGIGGAVASAGTLYGYYRYRKTTSKANI